MWRENMPNEVNESIRCIDSTIEFKKRSCEKYRKSQKEFENMCKGEMDNISYFAIYGLIGDFINFQEGKIAELNEVKEEIMGKYKVGE